jgi:hypothetical protein
MTFLQLNQEYVQNSTKTTLPLSFSSVRGSSVFSHTSFVKSGASPKSSKAMGLRVGGITVALVMTVTPDVSLVATAVVPLGALGSGGGGGWVGFGADVLVHATSTAPNNVNNNNLNLCI